MSTTTTRTAPPPRAIRKGAHLAQGFCIVVSADQDWDMKCRGPPLLEAIEVRNPVYRNLELMNSLKREEREKISSLSLNLVCMFEDCIGTGLTFFRRASWELQ